MTALDRLWGWPPTDASMWTPQAFALNLTEFIDHLETCWVERFDREDGGRYCERCTERLAHCL